MELHGEKLAGEGGGEDVGLGGGEGVVGDDWEAGDTAQQVRHGQTGEERRAVVVQSPRPPHHHQGQAVTNRPWGQTNIRDRQEISFLPRSERMENATPTEVS